MMSTQVTVAPCRVLSAQGFPRLPAFTQKPEVPLCLSGARPSAPWTSPPSCPLLCPRIGQEHHTSHHGSVSRGRILGRVQGCGGGWLLLTEKIETDLEQIGPQNTSPFSQKGPPGNQRGPAPAQNPHRTPRILAAV